MPSQIRKSPERAAIVLLNDPVAGEDGLLQPREIGQFRLNAGVVVLSACDTAIGPTLGQEGVLNIARAFLLAGAQSVIMTLWPGQRCDVDGTDATFLREYGRGSGHCRRALTRSKSGVIEQFGAAALPTVAAFQIVGVGDYRVAARTTPQKTTERGCRPMNSNSSGRSTTMSFDQSTMREVIERVSGLLEKKCIRLNGHEPNWRALFSEHSAGNDEFGIAGGIREPRQRGVGSWRPESRRIFP